MRLRVARLAAALVLVAAPARAQWAPQSPSPTHLDVRGVAAPTAQRVFVATEDNSFDDGGALFESTDGGATWTQRAVPESLGSPLNGLFFLDGQHGWAFGNEQYRTTDGGTTWEALPLLGTIYRMEFYSPAFGVASTNGGLYLSRDGGLTWTDAPDGLWDFSFADAQTGLGVSPTGLYRTTDGGATFAPVRPGAATAVAFLTATTAVGIVDGQFVRSTDAGLTWTAVGATDRTYLERVSADVVLAWAESGFFPSEDGAVVRSADGGQTWTPLGTVVPDGVNAFTVVTAQTVVALATDGDLFHSADAGATWTQTFVSPGPRPSPFSQIAPVFADAQTGYVAYGPGFVLQTTDGGQTWTQVSSGSGASLADVARFPDGALVAVGAGGTVLTSAGGTGPWTLRAALTLRDLVAVQALGATTAVAVDQDARVYLSTDRGATWTAAAGAPPSLDATDVHFTTPLDGYVSGAGFGASALWRTQDGGATWTPVDGPLGQYVALDVEGQGGWTANGGRVYATADGGATWTPTELPDEEGFLTLRDVDFWSESVGYAVGMRGYAARSTDGGATWERLPTPDAEHDFTDLHLVGPNELWVSTRDGVAYYSATGGQNWALLPAVEAGFGGFSAIAASPGGDAWMVGDAGSIYGFAGPPPPPLNRPPEASFTFTATRLVVAFTDTSTDPDGTVVGHTWDFDDGATSTEANPTHTFTEAGTYIVRLTVTDDDGDTSTAGRIVVVSPGPGGTFGGFTEVTPFGPPFVTPQDEDFWVATTAPADYDLDGDVDVAVLGYYVVYNESVVERLILLRNDGPGPADEWGFTTVDVPLGDLTTGASDLAWGDVDGDGDDDLAVGTDGATVLYRNDAGTLVATDTALPGYGEDNMQADFDLRSITWADIDNDGDLDLLLPSVFDVDQFEYRTALMRNDGPNGSGGWLFTEVAAGLPETRHAQSAWADSDADGDLDLLLVHVAPLSDDGFVRHYRNDGSTFVGADLLGGLTVEHGEAQWGDYDADGDLDILVAGHVGEGGSFDVILRVYRNDGGTPTGPFTPIEIIDGPMSEGWFDLTAATWADYDSDGDVDILLTGSYNSGSQIEGRAMIYLNEGGTFTNANVTLPAPQAGGTRGGTFSWLDLDGDGDLDYFIAGEYFVPGGNGLIEAQMHAYRNDAEGTNAAPSAPSGLAATPAGSGGRVALAWTASTDDSTPASALTYELDLRRDGQPVATGQRLPEPGPLGATTAWTLDGLADGVYTWTLRAVDSAFNGSPAAEGTFTVGVVAGEEGRLPLAYALAEAAPNPFTGATVLRFALPEAARVDLAVYDLLGRRVATLVGDARPAGAHEVRWDAAGLSAGTYVVRFSAGTFTAVRRVTVVR